MRTSSRRLRNQITLLVVNIAVQALAANAGLLRFGAGVPAEIGTRPPGSVDWRRDQGPIPSGVPTPLSSFASGAIPDPPEVRFQPVQPAAPPLRTCRPKQSGTIDWASPAPRRP